MSRFRAVLSAHLRGQAALGDVERALEDSLGHEAELSASHGALIEALYRGRQLSGDSYAALMRQLNSSQSPRVAELPSQLAGASDRTILRPVAPVPDVASDKTQLRVPHTRTVPSRDPTSASSWSDPSHWAPTGSGPLGPGTVIKDRFVLVEKIGQGGMGTVFRARDLRKEEALDRNPFVAIKVLNEDFKRHPRSLQALQREARKSQALAHPNIVTVYDFDRDGTNVFMVMELLEGEPLDELIRRNKETGLDPAQAWQIALQICKGMSYAHEQGIVHADFKPANAFLMRDGGVKIFDFGIARAVHLRPGADGSQTSFDPGTLGALTPAYASREVALGQEPEASDDVYAIACVIYELLTGSHPYNRVAADVASAKRLVVPRPALVSGSRWRALRSALAFGRSKRPSTAKALLDALVVRRRPPVLYASIGVAALAVLVIGVALLRTHFASETDRELTAALASANASQIDAVLPRLHDLAPERRAALFLNESARVGLIRHFERRIDESVDAAQGHYDYPRAEALLVELTNFFADSQAVQAVADRLNTRKHAELERQASALESSLQQGVLIERQGAPNVASVVAIVQAIDPRSPLLVDARLPAAFAEQARAALAKTDTVLATELVTAGSAVDPGDPTLARVGDEVRDARAQALDAETNDARTPPPAPVIAETPPQPGRVEDMTVDQLHTALTAGLEKPTRTLTEAQLLARLVAELAQRGAEDTTELKRTLKIRLAGDVAAIRSRRGIEDASRFAEGAYALFPDSPALRKALTDTRLAAAELATQRRDLGIEQTKRNLTALLNERRPDDAWPAAVEALLKRLTSELSADDLYLKQANARVAALYVTRAASLRSSQRLADAGRMLASARAHGAAADALAAEEQLLAQAQAGQEAAQAERDRVAQIDSVKQKLLVQAQANEVVDALETLRILRASLPKQDAFVAQEGPAAIGRAYLRMASSAARDGRLVDAIGLVDRGRAVGRTSEDFEVARRRYLRYRALAVELSNGAIPDVDRVRHDFALFASQDLDEEAAVARWLIGKLVARSNTTANLKLAGRLSDIARQLNEQQATLLAGSPNATAGSGGRSQGGESPPAAK
jgi:serine/threonine protein kinase